MGYHTRLLDSKSEINILLNHSRNTSFTGALQERSVKWFTDQLYLDLQHCTRQRSLFGASITACFCLTVIFSSTSVTPNYEHNAGTVRPARSQNTTSALLHLLELNCFMGPRNRSIGALQIAIFSCCNTKPCCGACCQMRSSRSNFFSGAARAASPKVLPVTNPAIPVFFLSLAAPSTTGRTGRKGKLLNRISKEAQMWPRAQWCRHCCGAAYRWIVSPINT